MRLRPNPERSAFEAYMKRIGVKADSIMGGVFWKLWQAACAWQRGNHG